MTDTTTLTRLRAMRELLSAPERWTQGSFAEDDDRFEVEPRGPFACRWCMWGGWMKCGGRYGDQELREVVAVDDVVGFNDTHTHAEVLALIDGAIAKMEGQC